MGGEQRGEAVIGLQRLKRYHRMQLVDLTGSWFESKAEDILGSTGDVDMEGLNNTIDLGFV